MAEPIAYESRTSYYSALCDSSLLPKRTSLRRVAVAQSETTVCGRALVPFAQRVCERLCVSMCVCESVLSQVSIVYVTLSAQVSVYHRLPVSANSRTHAYTQGARRGV